MSEVHFESEVEREPNVDSVWSYPLVCLFQILTGASLFFACLRVSPVLAIVLTLLITPAIVRTTVVADLMRRRAKEFGWKLRGKTFLGSLAYVLLVSMFGLCVFVLISLMFGVFGWLFSVMVNAYALSGDAIVLGTVGGMAWGVVGGFLAVIALVMKTWMPRILVEA